MCSREQCSHERLVLVGVGVPQFVIEMNDRDYNPQLGAQCQQKSEQGDRVRPTRDSDRHAVTRLQKLEPADMVEDLVGERLHGDMLQLATLTRTANQAGLPPGSPDEDVLAYVGLTGLRFYQRSIS